MRADKSVEKVTKDIEELDNAVCYACGQELQEDKKTEIAKAEPSQTQEMNKNIKFCVNNHRSYDTKTNLAGESTVSHFVFVFREP